MAVVGVLLLVAVTLVQIAQPELAQPELTVWRVDTSGHPQVELTVAAPPTSGGDPIAERAFSVQEGGEQRDAQVVALDPRQLGVAVVVDPGVADRRLYFTQGAAVELLRELPRQTRAAVVGAGGDDLVLSELGGDRAASVRALSEVRADDDLELADLVAEATDALADAPRRQIVVVGADRASFDDEPSERLADRLRATDTAVHVIGVGDDEVRRQTAFSVAGGTTNVVQQPRAQTGAALGLARDVANLYDLSFRATGTGPTDVTVAIKGRRINVESTVTARLPEPPPAEQPAAPDSDEDSGSFPWPLLIVALVLGVIVATGVLGLLRTRRYQEPMEDPEPFLVDLTALEEQAAAAAAAALRREHTTAMMVSSTPVLSAPVDDVGSDVVPPSAPATNGDHETVVEQNDEPLVVLGESTDASPSELVVADGPPEAGAVPIGDRPIPPDGIPGLDSGIVKRLAFFGITTAGDVDPVHGPMVEGRPVRVTGLDQDQLAALLAWRRGLRSSADSS